MKLVTLVVAFSLVIAVGAASAETGVVARPAQVITQFAQTIAPEPPVVNTPHQHSAPASGCCSMKHEMKQAKQAGSGCCCSMHKNAK
jgi:hypothetical protein